MSWKLAPGASMLINQYVYKASMVINEISLIANLLVIDSKGIDVILWWIGWTRIRLSLIVLSRPSPLMVFLTPKFIWSLKMLIHVFMSWRLSLSKISWTFPSCVSFLISSQKNCQGCHPTEQWNSLLIFCLVPPQFWRGLIGCHQMN